MQFEGIYPPVITPFQEDFSIDWDGWAKLIEFLVAEGVHGIIIGGTTGEFYSLNREERVEQLKRGKEIIPRDLPMIAGVNALNAFECPEFAIAARDAGADALLVAAPPYSLPTERELAAHCLRIDRAANLPIMLYNYPGRTGVEMGEDFLERVGQSVNFRAIKEASGDIDRVHLLAREYPHMQLSIGAEDQALEFFAWGARSWVSPIPNFYPKPVIKLYESCVLQGDFELGRRLMKAILPVATQLERSGKFLQCVKYAGELLGLPAGAVRPPLQPLKKEVKRKVREALFTARIAVEDALSAVEDQPAGKVASLEMARSAARGSRA